MVLLAVSKAGGPKQVHGGVIDVRIASGDLGYGIDVKRRTGCYIDADDGAVEDIGNPHFGTCYIIVDRHSPGSVQKAWRCYRRHETAIGIEDGDRTSYSAGKVTGYRDGNGPN